MRKLITLFFSIVISISAIYGQNMVPNGDFEYITTCPTTTFQLTNCIGWENYIATPDYFNGCGSGVVSVPTNFMGFQPAASGTAYAGFIVATSSYAREGIGRSITPLTIGATYYVALSASLTDNSRFGINGLGVHFIQNGPTVSNALAADSTIPKVSFASYGPVSDKVGWTRLSGTFVADSAYNFIAITSFGPYASYVIDTLITGMTGGGSYYYVDSVVVRLANGINNLYADSMICVGDTFQVPYTLNSFWSGSVSNVFSVQLSNASGAFSSGTTIIGTRSGNTAGSISCVVPNTVVPGNNYRIRIVSNNFIDSSGYNGKGISIGVVRPNVSNSNNGPFCIGQQLNLTATSATTGVNYKWTGPSGFNSTMQNPIINSAAVANSGNYIVTAKLYGCISKDTTTVVVVSASSVNVTGSTSICERDTMYLNTAVFVPAISYSWSGPGGFSSTNKDTIRTNSIPAMSGDYVLSANYGACIEYDTVTVLVKPQAVSRTIGSNSPVCMNDTLKLNAGSSSTGVAYTWTGPNSFVSTTSSSSISSVTSGNAGKYIVNYLLNGCLTKDSLNVVVNQVPSPVVASANTPLCEGSLLNLNCTNSTSGVGYSWVGPGAYTSTSQSPTRANVTPVMSGDYIVMATNSSNCTSKDTVTVLVKPLPANVNAGTNAPICEGATLYLTGNTSSSGVSFFWAGPNSFSSTLQNPNFSPATTNCTGNYVLTVTLNGCSVLDTVYAQVNQIPSAPTPSANTPVCVGQDLQLGASTVAGGAYAWSSTTGFSSNVQNPVRSSAITSYAAKYYVTATVNGCTSARDSITVTVNLAPVINIYPSPKDSICVGQSVTLVSSTSNTGSSFTRSWFKNNTVIGGAANANYSTTTAADGDEYCAAITVYGVCATPYTDTSNLIKMHVLPYLVPTVSIAANPNTTVKSGTMINFTATPANGGLKPGYQWLLNGSYIVGATSNIWGASTLSNNDIICAEMTSSYLCPNPKKVKSDCIKVSIESTGIVGVWTGNTPSIYPNPAKEILTIEGIEKGTKIQLNDVLGRVVIIATSTSETSALNMSHLAAGSYLLILSKDNGDSMTVKVVKE